MSEIPAANFDEKGKKKGKKCGTNFASLAAL